MSLMDAILNRQSARAADLDFPHPSSEEIDQLLQCAMSAPDHGAVRPWHFIVIAGDARNHFADHMVNAYRHDHPDATEEMLNTVRSKPLRAPMIIAAYAKTEPDHPKIPREEQILATAAGIENILLAAPEMGYSAVWLTGWPTKHPMIKNALGLEEKDEIVGYIYIGTEKETPRPKKRLDVKPRIRHWTGA